jgi:hypothetical protein
MDIRKFAVSPTGTLHLRDAKEDLMFSDSKKTKPMTVNLYSPGSKEYAKAQANQQNRMLEKLRKKGKPDQTDDSINQERALFLADCTASFENVEMDGLTGRELALAVYSENSIGFIADQVNKYLGEWGNFLA